MKYWVLTIVGGDTHTAVTKVRREHNLGLRESLELVKMAINGKLKLPEDLAVNIGTTLEKAGFGVELKESW